jgi:outer membrane protein OmpA-like peptidoglycan-associated protein
MLAREFVLASSPVMAKITGRRGFKTAVFAVLAHAGAASAQQASFHLDRLEVPGGPEDGMVLFRPVTQAKPLVFAQLGYGYSLNPLKTSSVTVDQGTLARSPRGMVQHQLTSVMTVGTELLDRLTVAATLPVSWLQIGQNPDYGNITGPVPGQRRTTFPNTDGPAVGDTRLDLRYIAYRTFSRSFAIAPQLSVFVPSGTNSNFGGDGGFSLLVLVAAQYSLGFVDLVANTGIHFRPRNSINDPTGGSGLGVGNEWRWAVGAFVPLGSKLRIGGTLFGQTGIQNDPNVLGNTVFTKQNTPLEWNGEARVKLGQGFWLGGSAGTMILGGYGAPDLRVLATVGVAVPVEDSKPNAPGDPPRIAVREKGDGDRDEDGIPDSIDACPDEPEDHKEPDPNDGCPMLDRDHDGIPDRYDQCPDVPEDLDGIEDGDGCPEDDFDKDGILDPQDACPREPGPPNADPKKNGCPQFIRLEEGKVRVLQQVHFGSDSATILPDSFAMLKEVVELLKANPGIKKILVEGHTDNVGGEAHNRSLSERRAASVRAFLIKQGVAEGRVESKGFGLSAPIESNATEKGRAANRRVEFKIVEEEDPNAVRKK